MTTHLETIRAAIVVLELHKNHMTKGEWWIDSLIKPTKEFDFGVFNGQGRIAMARYADAGLIATLHRTIDPQLKLLRTARDYLERAVWQPSPGDHVLMPPNYVIAVELAQAILDGDE